MKKKRAWTTGSRGPWFVPPVTGRNGRTIWEELNEKLPRPTDFTDHTPSWEDA